MAEQKKPTKARSITRSFVNDSGVESARATNDAKVVVLTFANKYQIKYDLSEAFGGSLPAPSVGRAAAAFGLSTSLGNAGNTAGAEAAPVVGTDDEGRPIKGEADPNDIIEAVEERLARLKEGTWAAEREGAGPPTTIMVEAFVEYRKVKGLSHDEPRIDRFREDIKDKGTREQFMADADYRRVYEGIRSAKAIARATQVAASGLAD